MRGGALVFHDIYPDPADGGQAPYRVYLRALAVFADMQHLRHEDGSYWTGWQFVNQRHFPNERSGYTAAAVVLAADALARATPGSGIFRDAGGREARITGECGCERARA
jgi:hypothetical protein